MYIQTRIIALYSPDIVEQGCQQ